MNRKLLERKNWPILAVASIMSSVAKLPFKAQIWVVIGIGAIAKPFINKRNIVAKENLKIAFPEKTEEEIDNLVKISYRSMVLSGIEITAAWIYPKKKFNKIKFEIDEESLAIYNKYHNDPNTPVICLGFHFHTIEIIGRYFGANHGPLNVMYQPNSNELIDTLMKDAREQNIDKCLSNKRFVSVIKSLKRKCTLWYAPDQDFGLEPSGLDNSVFAPFFGKQCLTLTVTPWLAEKSGAVVLPVYYVREECLKKYKIVFGEPLNFTGDKYHDAKITNEFLESAIIKHPEQYLWQHRRFRTRPDGEPQIY
jgi:KDO2-lipid IV(A) lauroyltransferase